MWQNVAATILVLFGVVVAVVIVVIYLRMYRKQAKSQEQGHDSTSFIKDDHDEHVI